MAKIFFYNVIAVVSLVLTFSCLSYSLPKQVLAEQAREGFPGRRVGGGTRDLNFFTEKPQALVPENNQSLTLTENPTFFFYVPQAQNPLIVEFALVDENGDTVYERQFATNGNSGVVGVSLPNTDTTKGLEVGKNYTWFFAIVTNPSDRSADIHVQGHIKRIQPSQALASQLTHSDPLSQVALYAANNLWYDAVATLAQLRRSHPNDAVVTAKWTQLLQSLRLSSIAKEPLVEARSNSL